jgi:hypothetical protein
MESPGDFYAMALHDDRLRAGLVAAARDGRGGSGRPGWRAAVPAARSALAAGLRALAALADPPPSTTRADRSTAAAR